MEMQIGQLSRKLVSQTSGGFNKNTLDNHKNESCNSIEMRDIIVSIVIDSRSGKKN